MLAIALFALGITARLMFHTPNFTPVIALALFAGVYMNKKYALLLPVVLMGATDIFLELHKTMFFTLGSILIIAAAGLWVRKNKNVKTVMGTTLASAVIFFLVTNFGVWLVTGLYPHSWEGLAQCFLLALPFFRSTLLSTVMYSAVLFGVYEIVAYRVKDTRLARVFLSI